MITENVEYRIACRCISSQAHASIKKQEYEDIKSAYRGLLEARYLEEKYNNLIQNFYEYELELSKLATHRMLFQGNSSTELQDQINTINRRIGNLLTSCKSYIDQSKHHLSHIFDGNQSKKKAVELVQSKAYDNVLGYRAMYMFRNYVQHCGFPVHHGGFGAKWVEGDGGSKLLFSVTAHFDIEILGDSKDKLNKKVFDELQNIRQKHDINLLMREYIAALSDVHRQYREMISDKNKVWEEVFNAAIKKYREIAGAEASILGLSAIAYVHNEIKDSIPIFMEPVKYRKYLENKNGSLSSLPSRHVDNSIRE